MFNPAAALAVSPDRKLELERLVRNGNSPQKVALRCRLLLLAHQGVPNQTIAEKLNVSRPTVLALRAAFAKDGMTAVTGIRKHKRSPKVLTSELEQKILDATLKTRPGDGSTHWSVRMLATHLHTSRTIVHRVWQRHDVQPHRVERFKLSNGPRFEEKLRDIVGLYLNSPDRALVLCVDEKSQIQALDRTAPILPLRPGLPERQTTITNVTARPPCSPHLTSSTEGDRDMPATASQPRVRPLPESTGTATSVRPGNSPDHGQLLHA